MTTRPFQPGLFGGPDEMPARPERATSAVPLTFPSTVPLDLEEQDLVRAVAWKVARRYERGHDEQGRPARMKYYPPGMSLYDVALEGFGAELAVAVHLGLPWNEGKRGKPDVGKNVEVRQSRHDAAHLTLHAFDKFARIYVLAVGQFPTYRLAGWIVGANGVGLGHYSPPGVPYEWRPGLVGRASSAGVWIVPQTELRPMRELTVRR